MSDSTMIVYMTAEEVEELLDLRLGMIMDYAENIRITLRSSGPQRSAELLKELLDTVASASLMAEDLVRHNNKQKEKEA